MNVITLLTNARQAWLADRHSEALEYFRAAYAQKPADLRLAIEVASYLGMRFEIDEAVRILRQCEAAAPAQPQVWQQLGLAYQRAYRTDDAMRCFRIAARDGAYEQPILSMVEWLERRGKLKESRDLLSQFRLETPHARKWHAKLLRREGELSSAETELRKLTAETVDTEIRIRAWYELADICDEQDRPTEAIAAAKEAKKLQAPKVQEQLRIAKSLAPVERNFVSTVTQDHFDRWQATSQHWPTALLTGLPRSGTSMMCRMLDMHEELAVADEIEAYPTYLQPRMLAGKSGTSAAAVLDSLSEAQLEDCRSLYRRWLSAAIECDLRGRPLLDKFPSTTFLISPFRRLFPHAVIVVAIRDPRDVVLSCFLRHLELNPVSAMYARLDFAVARCHAEMRAWLELRKKLPPPWHEVRYEDIVAGDFRSLAKVHHALGLTWHDRFADIRSTLSTNPVRSPTYAQLQRPITAKRIGRWQQYRDFLAPHLGTLTQLAVELGY